MIQSEIIPLPTDIQIPIPILYNLKITFFAQLSLPENYCVISSYQRFHKYLPHITYMAEWNYPSNVVSSVPKRNKIKFWPRVI